MKVKYNYQAGDMIYSKDKFADYEYELDEYDEDMYIIHTLEQNFDKETANKILRDVIKGYNIKQEYLAQCDIKDIAEFCSELAKKEFEEKIYG